MPNYQQHFFMDLKTARGLIEETYSEWNEDKAVRLAAALAYYTSLSLAPILIIAISVAGLAFGHEAARSQIMSQIQGLIGSQGAEAIESAVESASQSREGAIATYVGIAYLLFGASGVFGQLQDALNAIWDVEPVPGGGITGIIKSRFFSFTLVLGTGFLLLVSLVLSAVLAGFGEYIRSLFQEFTLILQAIDFLTSLLVTALLFALIFKVVPDADIAWSDVWIGAAVTAILFAFGRFLIGFYLGQSAIGSVYGAAGSLAIILIWVYYSANILLAGAEFTQVYANMMGSRVVPKEGARLATRKKHDQEGLNRR